MWLFYCLIHNHIRIHLFAIYRIFSINCMLTIDGCHWKLGAFMSTASPIQLSQSRYFKSITPQSHPKLDIYIWDSKSCVINGNFWKYRTKDLIFLLHVQPMIIWNFLYIHNILNSHFLCLRLTLMINYVTFSCQKSNFYNVIIIRNFNIFSQ